MQGSKSRATGEPDLITFLFNTHTLSTHYINEVTVAMIRCIMQTVAKSRKVHLAHKGPFSNQLVECVVRRIRLSHNTECLLESLLCVVLDVSESYPGIAQRDNKQEKGENLTESPFAFFVTLIGCVALQGQFGVHDEEEVDQEKDNQTDEKEGSFEECGGEEGGRRLVFDPA
jgi:hypothetical protein